ncbi:hypothetical protein ES319_A05G378400v1 [Gossypium barbadense]|nr:hypothetical protein ES319_A05G378400v1 [Gossypium barbadense]
MLKRRFANTILKAQKKALLDHVKFLAANNEKYSHSRSKKHRSNSLRSSSQNSESSDTQELYLELRLSL